MQKSCLTAQTPGDLSLDFKNKKGTWCRGEQCNDGSLALSDTKGQWDDRKYRVFSLTGKNLPRVNGVIELGNQAFAANSEIGFLFGRCEK